MSVHFLKVCAEIQPLHFCVYVAQFLFNILVLLTFFLTLILSYFQVLFYVWQEQASDTYNVLGKLILLIVSVMLQEII